MDKARMEKRNEKIKQAVANGEPKDAVAARFKLTSSRINQILAGENHINQAREQRRRRVRKSQLKKRKIENEQVAQKESIDHKFENQIAYAYGHVESWLQIFSSIAGYSFGDVASRVGELLSRQNMGKVVRTRHRLSSVR